MDGTVVHNLVKGMDLVLLRITVETVSLEVLETDTRTLVLSRFQAILRNDEATTSSHNGNTV